MLCAVARVSRIDPWMDALLAAIVMMRSCPCAAMLRHGQVVAAVACVVARSDVVWWPESDVMLMRSLNGRRWCVVQLDGVCGRSLRVSSQVRHKVLVVCHCVQSAVAFFCGTGDICCDRSDRICHSGHSICRKPRGIRMSRDSVPLFAASPRHRSPGFGGLLFLVAFVGLRVC